MHRRSPVRNFARRVAGIALLAIAVAGAHASELPRLPAEAVRAYPALIEVGAGSMRWFGFHLYDARLWVRGEQPDAGRPFVLALRYARDFKGRGIAQSSFDEIERLGYGTADVRARWRAEMERVFPDVDAGHELAGLNVPGRGVRFYLDGRPIGEIADVAFARAFFAIWLDPRTRAQSLRTALLGADGARAR
jgi:hypothetical protein